MYDRNEIIEALRTNQIEVTFTKRDGTERVMHCSLIPNIIPEALKPNKHSIDNLANQDTDNVRVFDLDKAAWRSFNVSSVISWRIIND